MTDSARHELASLIDAVLSGALTALQATRRAEKLAAGVWQTPNAQSAYHELIHYREDEDIRAGDEAYAHNQRERLKRFADLLRT